MTRSPKCDAVFALALLLCLVVLGCGAEPTALIVNATVVDPTGQDRFEAGVRLERERIVEVGDLQPKAGELVIDAAGLVQAPGFIDTHSHVDCDVTDHRDAPVLRRQSNS